MPESPSAKLILAIGSRIRVSEKAPKGLEILHNDTNAILGIFEPGLSYGVTPQNVDSCQSLIDRGLATPVSSSAPNGPTAVGAAEAKASGSITVSEPAKP